MPAGAWRWAALGFVLLALAAAALASSRPRSRVLPGYALLLGIAVVAVLFVFAVWPRGGLATQDALRVAEAAAKANVAWAITGDGRRGAGLQSRLSPHGRRGGRRKPRRRRNWRWRASPSSAVLYRLSRDAAEGQRARGNLSRAAGAGDRCRRPPLADKQTAWWFTPALAASTSPQPVLTPQQPLEPASAPVAPERRSSAPPDYRRSVPRCARWAWPLPMREA